MTVRAVIGLIAVAILYKAQAYNPTVDITETDPVINANNIMYARQTVDVTMSCYVENPPVGTFVYWRKTYVDESGRAQMTPLTTDTSIEDNTKYGLEKPADYTWKLRVKNVQVSDQGVYHCIIFPTRESPVEKIVTLIVQIPPRLDPEKTSPDRVVDEGDPVELICNATGLPPPTIEWSRLGNALLPNNKEKHMQPILLIKKVTPADRGFYRCLTYNAMGRDMRDIRLDVRFRPLISGPTIVRQAPGYMIELRCEAEANPFPGEDDVAWIRDTTTYSSSFGRFRVRKSIGAFNKMTLELIISPVQESDYGNYQCRIANNRGTTFYRIELARSNVPVPSAKLGIITSGASGVVCHTSAVVASLFVWRLLL